MKHIWILCLFILGFYDISWAQRKVTPATKALTENVQTIHTPKQLLEATRLFIEQNGHRPRTAFYHKKAVIPFNNLTSQQQIEVRLGQAVSRIFIKSQIDPSLNSPSIQKLRNLVTNFPNTKKAKNAQQLLAELRQFVKQNGRRPLTQFYQNGTFLKLADLNEQQQAESRLGQALYALVKKAETRPELNDTSLSQIRQLLMQYPLHLQTDAQSVFLQRLPQLIEDTRTFIDQHHRRPRMVIFEKGHRISFYQQTPQQQYETKLGQILNNTFSYIRNHNLQEEPMARSLAELLGPYTDKKYLPAPSTAQVLAQAKEFIILHGHRPRKVFTDEQGNKLSLLTQLSPQQAAERRLANAIARIFFKANRGQLAHEETAVQELRDLISSYPLSPITIQQRQEADLLVWEETLTQLEQYLTTYQHFPRKVISRKGIILKNEDLSAKELEEVQLGRKLHYILEKATAQGLEKHPLIIKLQEYIAKYSKRLPPDIPLLAEQLETFINAHHR